MALFPSIIFYVGRYRLPHYVDQANERRAGGYNVDFLSRVKPELREGLSLLPVIQLPDDLNVARQIPTPSMTSSAEVRISERFITGGDGQELLIRIYQPEGMNSTKLPVLLWFHGGGYVMGRPNGDDTLCGKFVESAGCVVISPDYRLAPEYPYPAALEDCYATLVWIASGKFELNVDVERIAIGGGSAGGGLTAALALLTRDRVGPSICFEMPLYPMIDDRNITLSSYEVTDKSAVWHRSNNLVAWEMYLGDHTHGDVSPYAAPSRATDLVGLPPTYICVGQLDLFRDEAIDFAAHLAQAGVDVELHVYPGCFHAFEHVVPDAEISRGVKEGYIHALKLALYP